jgi:hypothetical protein
MTCAICGFYRCICARYEAQDGVFVGRPPCVCGAAYRLHDGQRCPSQYRPDTLKAALEDLEDAMSGRDEARIFVARGNVQRLGGRP